MVTERVPSQVDDNSGVRLIMRPPSDALRRALSAHPERDRIDPARARREHADYMAAIEATGVPVTVLPVEPGQADACFTWDTVLAFARVGGGPLAPIRGGSSRAWGGASLLPKAPGP